MIKPITWKIYQLIRKMHWQKKGFADFKEREMLRYK